jgi:hypothetical protein
MARPPRQHKGSQRGAAEDQTEEYFVLDENATEIAGRKLTDQNGKRASSVRLSPADAAFHIANGSISTSDPKENKAAAEAMEMAAGEVPSEHRKAKR